MPGFGPKLPCLILLFILLFVFQVVSPSNNGYSVQTEAGDGTSGFQDGNSLEAKIGLPIGITFNKANGMLYVTSNYRILEVDLVNKKVMTIAGVGSGFMNGDAKIEARFNTPEGIAFDMDGNLWVADTLNHCIRKIDFTTNQVSTVTGMCGTPEDVVGSFSESRFRSPSGIVFDNENNLIVADKQNNKIKKIDIVNQQVTRVAGGGRGSMDISGDLFHLSSFNSPSGVCIDDDDGSIIVADTSNNLIRKIDIAGRRVTSVGSSQGFQDGTFQEAKFSSPRSVAKLEKRIFLVGDGNNRRIRIINYGDGFVGTFAGTGYHGNSDGNALTVAEFSHPIGVVIDTLMGVSFVSDFTGNRIRRIEPICFSKLSSNPDVCSSLGNCTSPDTCQCYPDNVGIMCEIPVCFETPANVSHVCNGNGNCISPNNCSCIEKFSGEDCGVCSMGSYNSTTTCEKCTPGTYSNQTGMSFCFNCDVGYFTPLHGATICFPCIPGSYANETGTIQCSLCPSGTFNEIYGSKDCSLCPLGTYSNAIGANSSETCKQCRPGTYSNFTGSKECQECPLGQYNQKYGEQECTPCSPGFHSNNTGAIFCLPCQEGYFSPSKGKMNCDMCPLGTITSMKNSSKCDPCPEGTYNPSQGSSICVKCPSGTFSNKTGASDINECMECPPGTYSGEGFNNCHPCLPGSYNPSFGASKCELCSPGTFSNGSNSVSCYKCQGGYYSSDNGSSNCDPCLPGSYSREGSYSCTPCPSGSFSPVPSSEGCHICSVGTFSNQTNSTKCNECPPGSYASHNGSSWCEQCPLGTFNPFPSMGLCQQCPSGTYSNSVGSISCVDCSAGYYNPMKGSSECFPCKNGTYSDVDGMDSCLSCPHGTYNPSQGSSICVKCPSGTFSNKTGASDINECMECPPGTYSGEGFNNCHPCLPGSYNPTFGASKCELCPWGRYSDGSNSLSCHLCKPGTFSNQNGLASCINCSNGTYNPVYGATNCNQCPKGTYSNDTTPVMCHKCFPGEFSDEGSSQCSMCSPGFHSTEYGSSTCSPCRAGYFASGFGNVICSECEAGTFSELPGSSICMPCKEGYFSTRKSDKCVMCPSGTYSDVQGSDNCIKCPSNYYSVTPGAHSNRSCLPCPGDTVSVPGSTTCQQPSGIYSGISSSLTVLAATSFGALFLGISVVGIPIICLLLVLVVVRVRNIKHHTAVMEDTELQDLLLGEESLDSIPLNVDISLFQIDVEELTNLKEIGNGGSGCLVFKALWRDINIVVKMFRCTSLDNSGMEQFCTELKFYLSLRDKNIVYFYGACMKPPRIGIVMEYCANGTLKDFFTKRKNKISIKKKLSIAREIASGVRYLHSKNIIHRDLKSDNVLIDDDEHAKITDFGISKHFETGGNTVRVGTSIYMAPEVTMGKNYDEKCDVFSFGIILYEILTECFNPYGEHKVSNVEVRVSMDPTFRPILPHDMHLNTCKQKYILLMTKCWAHEVSVRPSFMEICTELEKCEAEIQ